MKKSNIAALVSFLFALSGMCGLIYEVAWFKYLSLFIGSTTYAQMMVLATFMGGLAAGYYVWGRKVDRIERRLRLYGFLEVGIGAFGVLYPWFMVFLDSAYFAIVQNVGAAPGSPFLLTLKFFFSFLTLILPTFLMGGTLPVLVRHFTASLEEVGRGVATLYFVNSLGAVTGSVLAGFFLIRTFGLPITVVSTGIFNIGIGLAAILLAAMWEAKQLEELALRPDPAPAPVREATIYPRNLIEVGLLVAGVSGFVVMVYEMTWTRLLINVFGSSTYSFSLMLIAFIGGITIGSWVCSIAIDRIRNLFQALGFLQLGIAVSMLLSLPLYERLPYYFWRVSVYFSKTPEAFPLYLAVQLAMAFFIMLVPTLLSGFSLPIVSRVASTDVKILGRSVGGTFAVNTAGTVLGALVTGLLFIPVIGIQNSIELGILINGALGIVVLFYLQSARKVFRLGFALIFGFLFLGYKVFVPSWNVKASTAGVFRQMHQQPAPESYDSFLSLFDYRKILFYKEGLNANVAVMEVTGYHGLERTLLINGKPDASSKGDLVTQILLGQVGMLFCSNPQEVLVIGVGSGVTAGSILRHPVAKLDVVEISPTVVEASSLFSEENHNFLTDPRTHLFVEDALSYLKEVPNTYDLIVSEPSNPWIAGIGNLFSVEYFNLCKSRLADDGMMVQWFHLYEMNDQTFQLVLRTFSAVFPSVSIWTTASMDVLLIGSEIPMSDDFDRLKRRFSSPSVREELSRVFIDDIPTLLSGEAVSHLNVDGMAGEGVVNSEMKPVLEFLAPLAFYLYSQVFLLKQFDERYSYLGRDLLLTRYSSTHPLSPEEYANIGRFHASYTPANHQLALAAYSQAFALDPRNVAYLRMAYQSASALDLDELEGELLEKLAALEPNNEQVLSELALRLYRRETAAISFLHPSTVDPVVSLLKRCIDLAKGKTDRYYVVLGDVLNRTGRFGKAIEYYKMALDHRRRGLPHSGDPPTVSIELSLAIAYYNNRDIAAAEQRARGVLAVYPNEGTAASLLKKIAQRKDDASLSKADTLTHP